MDEQRSHGAGADHSGEHATGGFDQELAVRPILKVGFWTAVICVAALLGMVPMYRWMIGLEQAGDPRPSPIPEASARTLPPEPRLQPSPEKELAALRAEVGLALETYGWVDRPAGIARLPIDRAIDLIVTRGLPRTPAVPSPTAPAPTPGAVPAP